MFVKVNSAGICGIRGRIVSTEADVGDGLPGFIMVGYLASEVREAQDRVRTALKIYQAEKRPAAHELPVGTIRTNRKSYIDIAVEDGYLRLLSVQLAGKKRLPVTDFLNGFKQIGEYKVD